MQRRHVRGWACWISAVVLGAIGVNSLASAAEPATPPKYQILKTPAGERFGLVGEKGAQPLPTLLIFASTIEGTLGDPQYCACGLTLAARGCLCVSLDLPCHGPQRREGEADGIAGWRQRLERDEPVIGEFNTRIKQVLDYLIHEGYVDPERIVAAGTSRGGFVALHYAATDKRVRSIAAFAPLTDLAVITEFAGVETRPSVSKLALVEQAPVLADRAVWMIIGNQDARVSTDRCIALGRRLSALAAERSALSPVELHVVSTAGHRTPANAHALAAAWLGEQLLLPPIDGAAQSK